MISITQNLEVEEGKTSKLSTKRREIFDVLYKEIQENSPHYLYVVSAKERHIIYYDEVQGVYEIDGDDSHIEYLISNIMKCHADGIDETGSPKIIRENKPIHELVTWYETRKTDEVSRFIKEYKLDLNSNGLIKTYDDFNKFSHYDEGEQTVIINMQNTCIKVKLYDEENLVEDLGFSKDNLFLSRMNVKYNPYSEYDYWSEKIKEILIDEKNIAKLRHFMAYGIINRYFKWGVCLMFYGPLAFNGKTTIIETYDSLFRNAESIFLHKISTPFGRQHLKKADFINADESHINFEDNGSLKQIILGKPVFVENKGIKNETTILDAKIMSSCNKLLPSINSDGGMQRRFEIIATPRSFEDKDDSDLGDKLCTDKMKSGIFNWIVEVIPSLIKNVDNFKVGIGERTRKFFEDNLTPIANFCDSYVSEVENGDMKLDEFHHFYSVYARKHNHKIESSQTIGLYLKDIFENPPKKRCRSERVDGKKTTLYTPLRLNTGRLYQDFPEIDQPAQIDYFESWNGDPKEELSPGSKLFTWLVEQLQHAKEVKYTDLYNYGQIQLKMKRDDCKQWLQRWIDEGKLYRNKGMIGIA